MEFISFRSPLQNKRLAKWIAKLEGVKVSDAYRDIFLAGIAEKRKEIALQKYSKSQVSFEKAAEMAGVTVWEFLELLKEKNMPLNISSDEILAAAGKI